MSKQVGAGTKARIRRIIALLLGLVEQDFPFETEIGLYELQAWSLFSDEGPEWPMLARLLATAMFLRREEHEVEETDDGGTFDPRPGEMFSSKRMVALLKGSTYRALFDGPLSECGGFSALITALSPDEFNTEMEKRKSTANLTFHIVDYRFRYFDHGGISHNMGNLSHAYVYRYNQLKGKLGRSRSTIQGKWQEQKSSSVFIYVSLLNKFDFFPTPLNIYDFLSKLSDMADDEDGLRNFFGQCAYVSERFKDDELGELAECFPDEETLPRVRPATQPLPQSDGIPVGLENYRDDSALFSQS